MQRTCMLCILYVVPAIRLRADLLCSTENNAMTKP